MLIRTEAPADILTIDRLLKHAFPTDAEANLVMRLRENGKLTLSLVACTDDGEVIGHALFSPVTLNGEDLSWQGLAPLAVHETIAVKALVLNSLKKVSNLCVISVIQSVSCWVNLITMHDKVSMLVKRWALNALGKCLKVRFE